MYAYSDIDVSFNYIHTEKSTGKNWLNYGLTKHYLSFFSQNEFNQNTSTLTMGGLSRFYEKSERS